MRDLKRGLWLIAAGLWMLVGVTYVHADDDTPRIRVRLENAVRGCTFKVIGDRKLYTRVYVTGKKPSVNEDGEAVMEWWIVPKDEGERSRTTEGQTVSDNVPEGQVLFYSTKWGRVLGPQGCKCPPWSGNDVGMTAER